MIVGVELRIGCRLFYQKRIDMSRTKKHPYTGAKRVSRACRNHGGCEWCRGNRTYKNKKREQESKAKED